MQRIMEDFDVSTHAQDVNRKTNLLCSFQCLQGNFEFKTSFNDKLVACCHQD